MPPSKKSRSASKSGRQRANTAPVSKIPKMGRPPRTGAAPTRHVVYLYPEHETMLAQILKYTKKRGDSEGVRDAITFQHNALRKESPDDFK